MTPEIFFDTIEDILTAQYGNPAIVEELMNRYETAMIIAHENDRTPRETVNLIRLAEISRKSTQK